MTKNISMSSEKGTAYNFVLLSVSKNPFCEFREIVTEWSSLFLFPFSQPQTPSCMIRQQFELRTVLGSMMHGGRETS